MSTSKNNHRFKPISLKLSSKFSKGNALIIPFDITAFLLRHQLTKQHSQIQIYNKSLQPNSNTRYYCLKGINHSFFPQWSNKVTSTKATFLQLPNYLELQSQLLLKGRKNKSMDKDKMRTMSMFESYEYWLNKKVESNYLPMVPERGGSNNKEGGGNVFFHSYSKQDIAKPNFTNKLILQKINETYFKRIKYQA